VSSKPTAEYAEYGINERYDSQESYRGRNSYYGNGKYPPDWDARREAVWQRQRYQCGRCGVYKGDTSTSEVHHVVHLQHGGSNALDNLVGLCGDCHALMHPDVDALRGNFAHAEVFPDEHSDDRVAVVRKPREDGDLKFDVERLSELTTPDSNSNAITSETVPTNAATARRAGQSLQRLLLNEGYVPRTTSYHRVSVHPRPTGLLSAITMRGVELSASGDGEAMETEDTGADTTDVYYSTDSTTADIGIKDPAGEIHTEQIPLEDRSGSRLKIEKPISAQPLTVRTFPEYAVSALNYFGWQSVKIGLIPALILAVVLSLLLPTSVSVVSFAGLVLLTGLLIRSRRMYRDIVATPSDRVVDERTESS